MSNNCLQRRRRLRKVPNLKIRRPKLVTSKRRWQLLLLLLLTSKSRPSKKLRRPHLQNRKLRHHRWLQLVDPRRNHQNPVLHYLRWTSTVGKRTTAITRIPKTSAARISTLASAVWLVVWSAVMAVWYTSRKRTHANVVKNPSDARESEKRQFRQRHAARLRRR